MTDPVCTNRIQNTLKNSPLALTLLLLLLALLSWGCSGDDTTTTTAASGGSVASRTVSTAEDTLPSTFADQAPAETPTTPADVTTPTPPVTPTGPVELVIANAQPATVGHGEPVTYTIKTRGAAVSVTMEVKGLEMSDCPLVYEATEGDLTVWTATVPAPATPGNYRYTPAAIDADGVKITPDSASAGSGYLTVT